MDRKDNRKLFNELRKEYLQFIFKEYKICEKEDKYIIKYMYSLDNKIELVNTIYINKVKNGFKFDIYSKEINYLIVHLGIVEAISYYKLTCSKIFKIECCSLDEFQINWWKKLIYNGLGELRYLNGFEDVSIDEFIDIIPNNSIDNTNEIKNIEYNFDGNLIPIGGGKDSIVTLELLKEYDNTPFMFYHKRKASYDTCDVAGFEKEEVFQVDRYLDEKLFELNNTNKFLNGHVPISSMIAFASYLSAMLLGKKYIVLSNESSSNEGNIEGTNINHQYSKSYEFEEDFNKYVEKYFNKNIKYFSMLRPISEYQIAKLLSNYEDYLYIFRSCNKGIKENKWCCTCSKCLFVYLLLLPFINKEKLDDIFGENLINKEELDLDFRKLIGLEYEKPFECVGTKDEIIYAIKKYIEDKQDLKKCILIERYIDYINGYNVVLDYDTYFNNEHFLPKEYVNILKKSIEE